MAELPPPGKPPSFPPSKGAQIMLVSIVGAVAWLLPSALRDVESPLVRSALVLGALGILAAIIRWLR